MNRARLQTLSVALSGDEPPSEFRLFVAGWNDTEHGSFLFDAVAAATVMRNAAKWGVDLMIDLEHQALDGAGADPTARDARGWFRLELRADGSLWAVNVRWTADGAQRLREKRQRYVSPAFEVDPETKRVTKIINVAITAIPATHDTPALVAASAREGTMNEELVKKALDALANGDAEAALGILKDMIANAAGAPTDAEPDQQDPAEPTEPAAEEMAATDPAQDDEEQAAVAASISRLTRITGKSTIGAAVEEVETWRASHLKLEAETAKLAKERAALEANERDALTASIAKKIGPAVAWADPVRATDRAKRKPAEPFASMPIAELRGFVTKLGAAKVAVVTPPVGSSATANSEGSREIVTPHGAVTLSARELAHCEAVGAKPETYAANKAIHEAAKKRGKKE